MQASRLFFWDKLQFPNDYMAKPTSELVSNGVFCYFEDPAMPTYFPLGQCVLDKITQLVNSVARRYGVYQITIPLVIRDELLEQGARIEVGFSEKIMHLSEPLNSYHLLFTPEPFILELAKTDILSYRQLPMRLCYHSDVFRALSGAKGILKSKQFKTFMGASIDADLNSVGHSLKIFEEISIEVFNILGIAVKTCRRTTGINTEFYYLGTEGESLFVPELDPQTKIRCLSLAMAYQYSPDQRLDVRFQDAHKSKKRVLMTTYGLGIQRLFYAVFDTWRDELGFNLPQSISPFRWFIIPKTENDYGSALNLYQQLLSEGQDDTFLDDRLQYSSGRRAAFSDYIGTGTKIIVHGSQFAIKNRSGDVVHVFDEISNVLLFTKSKPVVI